MLTEKKPIHFTAFWQGEKYELQTYEYEYRNLMILLYDKIFIEGFGECKGMGRCGTCIIKINQSTQIVTTLNKNEQTTLRKAGVTEDNLHLSCQVMVDKNLENISLEIIGSE
ncbi:MAG: 2Fe-2S iron-sulfur cluster-binding protein [Parafilimonas sp.]